jgi:uncharacterized OB-fold protein
MFIPQFHYEEYLTTKASLVFACARLTMGFPPEVLMPSSLPIAEGLFTWPAEEPQLIGSSCRQCATTTFPRQESCPRCTGVDVEERLLPRQGTLWTFTVQGFRPKSPYTGPEEFAPYGVGYVELAGQVMVESRLTDNDPAALAIGMPMELVVVPFSVDEDGNDIVTFAFRRTSENG